MKTDKEIGKEMLLAGIIGIFAYLFFTLFVLRNINILRDIAGSAFSFFVAVLLIYIIERVMKPLRRR